MAHPSDLAMSALKRLGRYLKERPRVLFKMPFQSVLTLTCTVTPIGRVAYALASPRPVDASCSVPTQSRHGQPRKLA